jgi:uncharacterized damage-inducible protein DinB
MNVETVRTLFAYNRWANERALASVVQVSKGDLFRELPSSFGSIHATLTHSIGAELVYLQRRAGVSPHALPSPKECPDLASLREFWQTIVRDQAQFLAGLREERLPEPITYINFQGEPFTYSLSDQILQMVNHSTYHRGQVTIMQRLVGATPVQSD